MTKEKLREYREDFTGFFQHLANKIKRKGRQIIDAEPEEPLIHIVVDLDGGDRAPEAVARGIRKAITEDFVKPEEVVAIGTAEAVDKFYARSRVDKLLSRFFKNPLDGVVPLVCLDKINMDDDFKTIGKKRKTSAIGIGLNMVKNGQAAAIVSAGNTAGMVGLGALILGRPKRNLNLKPAIAVPLPNESGPCLLLDAGAIHRASAEALRDCAIMGSIYAKEMWGLDKPIVRLLNIGSESGKGNEDLKQADELLRACSLAGKINYQGNIEGDKIFTDPVNVIVCSGEMGNNTIKVAEGVLNLVKDKMGWFWKVISFFWSHHKGADYKKVGGAIVLGLLGIEIISHGKSDYMAIASAIRRAKQEAKMKVVQKIEHSI